ncbi:MAG: MlaD family protein [Acidovorax sp.]|jgi:phospholipid/cholesterol/gamma-HCH transport system substrate-binding protein|nr:MlaD family protein [Acidovorax sp.]MDR3005696.1 MlaD family protein [Acidovorax sp.]
MENKSHAMAAGLFVVVVACLLAGLAMWLTRDRNQYVQYEMSTKDAISGLQPQATVRYKGVSVGKVTRIGFDAQNSGNVLIRIAVDSDAPISPETTFAQLGYQGVTGIAHIQLDDSDSKQAALPEGPSGLARLPMRSSPLTVLADQSLLIMGRVDEATRRVNELLNGDNQRRFSAALEDIAGAAKGVNTLTQSLNRTVTEHVAPAMAQLPELTGDARRSMQAMVKVGEETGHLAQDMRALTERMQKPGGALDQLEHGSQSLAFAADRLGRSTLPTVSQAAGDVSRAARSMGQAASGITNNPQSLIFGDGQMRPGPGEPGFAPPAASR